MEDVYANLLLIIATAMIFGGGIQLMMAVVTICFTIKYFYYKFIFVRFCRVPIQFNEILNERAILIMKIILIIRFMISLYMFGAEDVFAMEKSTFMKWVTFSLLRPLNSGCQSLPPSSSSSPGSHSPGTIVWLRCFSFSS